MTAIMKTHALRYGTIPVTALHQGTDVWPPSASGPKSIPGLLVWLDATQMTGKADGAPVPVWADASGNNLSPAVNRGTVTYRANGINGRASLRFGEFGAFSSMKTGAMPSIGDRTIFQVIQTLGNSYATYHTTQLQEEYPYMQTYGYPNGTIHTYSTPVLDSGVAWSGAPQMITVWCESSTASQGLRVDGNEVESSWSPTPTTTPWHIGGYVPAGYAMNGQIGEMIFYDRCLSPTERAGVEDYLRAKWITPQAPVYDPDTQAYLTATGLDSSYAQPLDRLVVGLKARGLWSKMLAIYPFIGGTAALHQWNLKDPRDADAAYRLTFNGGYHSTALGYRANQQGQSNVSSGYYADTHCVPLGLLTQDSTHLAFYSLADVPPVSRCEMGCYNWTGTAASRFHVIARYQPTMYYYGMSEEGTSNVNVPASSGLFVATRTGPASQTAYRNGVNLQTTTPSSIGLPPTSVWIGGINTFVDKTDLPCGFASIGSGLSDQENADLYAVVQQYQTALDRQVTG